MIRCHSYVFLYRRCRKQQDYEGKQISNPAYLDTTDENKIFSGIPGEGMNTIDSCLHDTEANHYNNIDTPDTEYNVLKCVIDDEYNRVDFKSNAIPFDENYGHINQNNNDDENEDYDHIKGMTLTNAQPYSNVCQQRKRPKETDEISTTVNVNPDSLNKDSDVSSATYDHLGQTDIDRSAMTDDQDTNYAHVPSSVSGSAGKQSPNYSNSNSAITHNEGKETDHDYFILEPNADNQRLRREDDQGNVDHQYFVLEPESSES